MRRVAPKAISCRVEPSSTVAKAHQPTRGQLLISAASRRRAPASAAAFVVLALFAVVLSLAALFPAKARAQADLMVPVPGDQLKASTAAQNEFLDQIRQRPTTASVTLMTVNISALRGEQVSLTLPDAEVLTLSRQSIDVQNDSNFTWTGWLSGMPGEVALVVHNGNITGTIQDDGDLYQIEPIGDGLHALIKVDETRVPPDEPPSFKPIERHGASRAAAPQEGDRPVEIDVLVAYTTAARKAVADIGAKIQLAILQSNQSYKDSKINIVLKLVDSFEVPYSEKGKIIDDILKDFIAMPIVNQRRDSSRADIAAMFVVHDGAKDGCGLSEGLPADQSTAFAVVDHNCAIATYVFEHELGHLQGARHDPASDPTNEPYAYGHGLQHPGKPNFRTIMAYNCRNGCPRLPLWSNPNVTYQGVATGTADTSDNARVLNETATTVAGFRSSFWGNEDWTHGAYYGERGNQFADVDGDGKADAIVVNYDGVTVRRSNGSSFLRDEDWTHGAYVGQRGNFFADVDGDGKADAIAVYNDRVNVRRSNGSGFLPSEDWTHGIYFGTRGTFFADVNGDGKADAIVVGKNGAVGADSVIVRLSNGSAFLPGEDWAGGAFFGTLGTFFADVDGDGKADAIAVNEGTVTVRRSNGSRFLPAEDWTHGAFFGSRRTTFADVDGDGKADAIAVNEGTVTVRRSDGSKFMSNEDWTHGPYFGSRGTFFADVVGHRKADAIAVNLETVTVRRSGP